MSKRKVTFDPTEDQVCDAPDLSDEDVPIKKKHTLDSDEEEDEGEDEKYNLVDADEIEGAEDGVAHMDNEMKITPFNMKDEMEEGFVDKDGSYVYEKKKDEITDSWLDNIDWVKVEPTKPVVKQSEDEDAIPEEAVDVNQCYKDMIEIMKAGETVQRTIQRLGKNTKKYSRVKASEDIPLDVQKEKAQLLRLTTLANQMLISGDMDVYEKTFEQVTHLIKQSASNGIDSDPFDLFGDADNQPSTSKGHSSSAHQASESSTRWEFKWENKDDAKIYGPNTNDQMKQWADDGYFAAGVWVRQIGKKDSQFYTSKRIDFDLYS